MNKPLSAAFLLGAACAALLIMVGVGCAVGSSGFENTLGTIWSHPGTEISALAQKIVWEIRLPRTLGALLAGGLLGLAGALAQGLFRNPLADPYLLGSASGASLGVASALALMGGWSVWMAQGTTTATPPLLLGVDVYSVQWLSRLGLTGAAFIGSTLAVVLTMALAKGVQHTLRLLLSGVVVGVVLGALASLVLMFSPDALQAMQSFMLGSTAYLSWSSVGLMAALLALCMALAWRYGRLLDGLSLGETTARSLGMPVNQTRAILVVTMALATGAAVAQTGLIAFVGLAAPHMVRALVRCTHGPLMVLSSATGALLLCGADLLARALLAPLELPVGLITALMGGGYLLSLMNRDRRIGQVA